MLNKQEIVNIFSQLNDNKLNYVLVHNIDNELPAHLETGKDIDVLVNKNDEYLFDELFQNNGYESIKHPSKYETFLYGVDEFVNYNNNNKVIFHFHFQLAVRSLDAGQWIPLDQVIQESAWKNRRFEQLNDDFGYCTLSYEDEFVTLITRSIFDKKEFHHGYVKRINTIFEMVNLNDVEVKLDKVFFKYAPYLLEKVQSKNFDCIINDYLEFKEY